MEIRSNAILFPSTRNTGPIAGSTVLSFPRTVQGAVAVLTGYSATFENHEDHHLGQLDITLTTTIDAGDNRQVHVDGSFALRDWSGTFDDAYSGTVEFALLADLVPATGGGPGNPRDDLLVTDAEVTQAIQHFRSASFLNSANVFPDNSIRLTADKATGIRLWVDYDRNSGLPPIASLSGTLTVVDAGGMSTVIAPLNAIVPRRENQLSRAMPNDTLNFVIPEGLCNGSISITARVFDRFNNTQFSADFQRTLNFEAMPAVRVFAVGINYTGPDVVMGQPTAAPVPADFTALFSTTELLYPIPAVTQTGYMTMDYDKEMKSDISKGCDRMGDLRGALKDLRGDSTDVFYGLLNGGVDTGSVGGCGGSGGAGVGIIGSQGTVAHELGHVFGRQHAPCDNVTRCARPLNTDDSYPNYSGFDSDSIGEFGFDTTNGNVLNPGNAHDMMGYSGNAWISPYTYKALMARIPVDNGGIADIRSGSSALAANRAVVVRPRPGGPIVIGERIPMPQQHLFTHFTIRRDRSVQWQAAFHFPTGPQAVYGTRTSFVIEQRDEKDEVLLSDYLFENRAGCGCSGDACQWPKEFSQDIPFDPRARRLVILDCDKPIFDEPIPEPPKLQLTCKGGDDPQGKVVSCHWKASHKDKHPLWYLLQWRDRAGVWRGVAPRTQRTDWDVPRSLWGKDREASLRVLATSGIATGVASATVPLARPPVTTPGPRRVTIRLIGVAASADATVALSPIVRVAVTTADGLTSRGGQVLWHGPTGGLLGRGRSLQLSVLPVGVHVVRASVLNGGDGEGVQQWLFERTRDGRYLWHRGTVNYPDPECLPHEVSATNDRKRTD